MSKRLIYAEDAIDALHDEIVRRRIDEDTNDDGALDEFDTEAIIKDLPSAQPEQRWIPVTERLPEYGTEVVTINKDDEYEINHVIDEEDGEWFFNGAVAWMPLPEPYKGEEG